MTSTANNRPVISDDDLNRAKTLIDNCGSTYKAWQKFNEVMEDLGMVYRMNKNTLYRVYRGQTTPSTLAFVIAILEQY